MHLQVDEKKILLRELSGKQSKAVSDKGRISKFTSELSSATSSANSTLPEITELSLPHVSTEEREQTASLSRQLNVTAAFARASTWVAGGTAALRVSPLVNISLKQYICSAKHLLTYVQYDCDLVIRACAALDKEGGHLSLKELWRRIHGPSSATSAQQKIDLLMRAPLLAVRVASSDVADGSWVITTKSDDTNYASLGGLLSAIEKPSLLGGKTIPKARLRALKQLASTPADARLIDLAALDTTSARTERDLSGVCHEGSDQRKEREQKMQVALHTFSAYKDLAGLDTISEIKAILDCGDDEITDAGLRSEVDKLRTHDEELEALEEEVMIGAVFVPQRARYESEEVDKELIKDIDFHEVLEWCTEEETDELASRLQYALNAEGLSIELDGQSLADHGKQEELVQAFGEGWSEVLRYCLEEPARLPPDDDDEDVDDLDDPEPLLSLEEHAHSMVLSLRRELGISEMDVEDEDEARTSSAVAERTMLSALSPRELVTKLLARHQRRRERQASASKDVAAARRSLAGETGRAPCLDTVLGKWPDIGDKIEAICADLGVGADAKRRDGALTINSAVNRGKAGVGFVRIRLELEARHGIEISPRGLRDLCTAKDRRMSVSRRYKNVVNLKYRRSVKRIGQDNLDDHKQNAKYKLLHYLRDRCEFDVTLWFQRDDHAKVRGGSSESTRGSSVSANGEGASALQHDYMNPELSSPLYASSLLVSGCGDGGAERCLAFVKAEKLAPSTPTQHYSDFYMLQERASTDPELKPIFFTAEGRVKPKVQLEVDGGADEDPTKRETRFLQTELLMGGPFLDKEQRRAQVGTDTREAGGTPKNKVERLNGEMTAAATNFHAMPTDEVVGPLRDDATGQYDHGQLEAMWAQHAEEYRSIMDRGCALNSSVLQAYAGATASSCDAAKALLERRPFLLLWLDPSTSKKKRYELEGKYPALVAHFKKVGATQEHCELLTRYSSCVRCCPSTVCQLCRGSPLVALWYDGGPSLRPVPPALHDPDRPGHYLEPAKALLKYAADNYKISNADLMAPSQNALAIFEREMGSSMRPFPPDKLANAAKDINDSRVTVGTLKAHFTKLRYIRLRVLEGRRKAAMTRATNKGTREQAALSEKKKVEDKKEAEKKKRKATAMTAVRSDEEESCDNDNDDHWNDDDNSYDDQFTVESILEHSGNGRSRRYKLKWVGHVEPTWEPTNNIDPGMVKKYLETLPAKVSKVGKAGSSSRVVEDSDDEVEETAIDHSKPGDKRKRKLRLSPMEDRCRKNGKEVVKDLKLQKVQTSGYNFNCLAFSTMIGTQQIGTSITAQKAAREQSDNERRLTHEEIISRLPQQAENTLGMNDEWWCGHSIASLSLISKHGGFMNESHVHGFTNRLERTIITIDVREAAVVLSEYVPGYTVAHQVSMREANERRQSEQQPLWLLLEPGHWSALLVTEPTFEDNLNPPADDANPPPDKINRVGLSMEIQGCDQNECDFICGECEWEPCIIEADHGHTCDARISSDGTLCVGAAPRFLRMPIIKAPGTHNYPLRA